MIKATTKTEIDGIKFLLNTAIDMLTVQGNEGIEEAEKLIDTAIQLTEYYDVTFDFNSAYNMLYDIANDLTIMQDNEEDGGKASQLYSRRMSLLAYCENLYCDHIQN